MAVENTDLERRVLAHEQILQALMAQLAEGQPQFLDRMHDRFASARRGSHEHDYVETADYAEAFLREVKRLGRGGRPPDRPAQSAIALTLSPIALDSSSAAIRCARTGGVWRVTCNAAFVGDYFSEIAARDAAGVVAAKIKRQGRRADIFFPSP